jgi:hypothetical protein
VLLLGVSAARTSAMFKTRTSWRRVDPDDRVRSQCETAGQRLELQRHA